MAKKANNKNEVNYNKKIVRKNMAELCTEYMKLFAVNNNRMRHIPFLLDGLKPGERRILYTLYNINKGNKTKYRKVSYVVGNAVLLHPHGDIPIYKSLVKMAEPWTNNECLIEGSGNFGSPMGDEAAAARYIECRLSKFAYKCFFEDFDPAIVDMSINYSGDLMEPECLPSRYPNVLINDTFGIGWGKMCSVPTYNLKDIFELTIKLIENPHIEDCTLIPDSALGFDIIDEGKFPEISETGKGKLKMRGVIEVDEERNTLIIKSAPLHVSVLQVKEVIITMSKENKLRGLKAVNDQSSKNDINLELLFAKEIDLYDARQTIFNRTQMQHALPIQFLLIDDYEDIEFNIRDILLTWIDYRRDTKRRYYNHKVIKAKERQHILETLLFILNEDNAERTLGTIKRAESKDDIIRFLMDDYGISSLQAKNISSMYMSDFSKASRRKYKEEKEEIDKNLKKYLKYVKSDKKIDQEIIEELEEGIVLFGKERRSNVITLEGEVKIQDTNHLLVFTHKGKVKKLPDVVKTIGEIDGGDYPTEIFTARNTTELLLFDTLGKVSKLPVHKIQQSDLQHTGFNLSEYCKCGKIVTIIPNPSKVEMENMPEDIFYLMISNNGIIKKTPISEFFSIRGELKSMSVKEGDSLQAVKVLSGKKDVVIYTSKGMGLRITSEDVKETGRSTMGVKAIPLEENETIIGMDLINKKDKFLFVLTSKGNAKISPMDTFKVSERNTKSVRVVGLEDGEEIVTIRTVKGKEKFKVYLKNSIEEISVEDIVTLPRLSKGKKLIPVRKGDCIIDVKEIK